MLDDQCCSRKTTTVSSRDEIQDQTRTRSKSKSANRRRHHKSRPRQSRSQSHGRQPERRTTVGNPQSVAQSAHARTANLTDEDSERQSMEESWNDSILSGSTCPVSDSVKPSQTCRGEGDRRGEQGVDDEIDVRSISIPLKRKLLLLPRRMVLHQRQR